jgi:hypothetical protein
MKRLEPKRKYDCARCGVPGTNTMAIGTEGEVQVGAPEFREFPKIYRMRREILITEKIDGSNASIYVPEDPAEPLVAGSRTRWIYPGPTDNYGFAAWVAAHSEELRSLGPGVHFGEWWGAGINKRYPEVTEKRFSLFNVKRWIGESLMPRDCKEATPPPSCCRVVPILGVSPYGLEWAGISAVLDDLKANGSIASRGNMRPEGIVVFHVSSRHLFKIMLERDDEPKGKSVR